MIANKKKIIITGIVILFMFAVICIALVYNNKETDYVFEGTFVKSEESVEVVDTSSNSFSEQNHLDENKSKDCFKRKTGDCVFV